MLIVAVAIVVLALALYFINFDDSTFSDDKADYEKQQNKLRVFHAKSAAYTR